MAARRRSGHTKLRKKAARLRWLQWAPHDGKRGARDAVSRATVRDVAGGPSFHGVAHAAFVAIAFVVVASGAVDADERARLAGLRDVSVSVDLAHPLDGMTVDDVAERLVGALRTAEPPLAIRDDVSDRIRLRVRVRPRSATTLRGFWLPFYGTYGIGSLQLGVERMVRLSCGECAFPGLVWEW
jgi:hypothetical protein